ncbi:MAG: YifB family Mg chelatase-like AAA ATPase [Peptococcaceae bacterium]|nr:YifB family Mg chelatase-like AAA ATPase [Peptococcaceae bacterium]MDH7525701.1 YifB family Mg chelatase-like AAA ATPase [Peptococcaceae bacterium]
MLARVYSCTTVGMDPHLIEVEVDVSAGLPCLEIVGLPDTTVRESKERVRTAIKNSGFEFPPRRIIVNLAPADIKKEGPGFDLPIAVGILAATRQLKAVSLEKHVLVGELSLGGRLRPVAGILPMALYLAEQSNKAFVIPVNNSGEAALTPLDTYVFATLAEVKDFLEGEGSYKPLEKISLSDYLQNLPSAGPDFSEVKGQNMAKRALEVAAAGGHNILLIGAPGSGKSMLARCLPSILPPLTIEEALEVSKIYSIAGLLTKEMPLVTARPFRSPHHSSSLASLIGGGQIPRPGEITLSTHGVLFLDELPEYRREVLESLRQPMEDRVVTISRVTSAMTYPARFQLVGAANPCYCGYFGDPTKECTCTPYQVNKYRSKLSGPLLDRIDIHLEIPRVAFQELNSDRPEESSVLIRERVVRARQRQLERFDGSGITCNAFMKAKDIRKYCAVRGEARKLLQGAFQSLGLSARAHDRILKIARTIADLEGNEEITAEHVAEAVRYRSFDRVVV